MSENNAKEAASMTSPTDCSEVDNALDDGIGLKAIEHRTAIHHAARWFSWIFGFAMLAAVTIAALHFSEERELLRIAQKAQPWWLAVALVLQAGTYAAQGETWRMVMRAGGVAVASSTTFKLSLAKLFIDQALPSGGISGTVVVAKTLEQRGVPRAVIMASVVVDSISYYGAYVLTLAFALLIMVIKGRVSSLILVVTLFLAVFSVALTASALYLSGRTRAAPKWLRRIPLLRTALSLLGEADMTLARSSPLILKSVLLHLIIALLDVATVWILIRSLGAIASPTGVFASFMVSTLLRTISIVPGGLGVFEATSVVTLQSAGVSVPVGLGATLLFRGVSFWLPMVPGLFFSRQIRKKAGKAAKL
jgi:Mg2+-importing ATPase